MATNSSANLIKRVRHQFASRHVRLLKRELLGPGFIRLTLGGSELEGFASPGFDDHVKLILPQDGQAKPNLPTMVDGRPHIDGARPEMRDYTPMQYDAAENTLQMDFAVHGNGAALNWAKSAPIGQWLGLAGPRGSMLVAENLDWNILFGDESAMPAIARRLQELPADTSVIVRIQASNPEAKQVYNYASKAKLDLQFVDSLEEAATQLKIPAGTGFVWGGGEGSVMAKLRTIMLEKGVPTGAMRLSSYWKYGVTG